MKILVVCAAGASSTFVAQRLRSAADAAGMPWTAVASTEAALAADAQGADLVLLGPHLAARAEDLRALVAARGAQLEVLAEDIFTDLSGLRTLQLVRTIFGHSAPAKGTP